MICLGPATRIYLAVGATDLRNSFEGLCHHVRHQFKVDPLSGNLFVFANRRKTRVKILYWDGSGLWVCAKRLGQGSFHWPRNQAQQQGGLQIVAEQLALLLGGIDLDKTHRRPWWRKGVEAQSSGLSGGGK